MLGIREQKDGEFTGHSFVVRKSSPLPAISEGGRKSPGHPAFPPVQVVLGSLKTQLGQEEMGNSATVES